jgi:hypothetical protein
MEYVLLLFRWDDEAWSSQTETDKKVKDTVVHTWLHKTNAYNKYQGKYCVKQQIFIGHAHV